MFNLGLMKKNTNMIPIGITTTDAFLFVAMLSQSWKSAFWVKKINKEIKLKKYGILT